jgi:hypothetical protein
MRHIVVIGTRNGDTDMVNISWNTTKTAAGYEWKVYSFGYQIPNVTLASGVCATRERATYAAKKMKMKCLHRARARLAA